MQSHATEMSFALSRQSRSGADHLLAEADQKSRGVTTVVTQKTLTTVVAVTRTEAAVQEAAVQEDRRGELLQAASGIIVQEAARNRVQEAARKPVASRWLEGISTGNLGREEEKIIAEREREKNGKTEKKRKPRKKA